MKIKTDSTHKSMTLPKRVIDLISQKIVQKIAQKIGIGVVTVGLLVTMSGCGTSREIDKISDELSKEYRNQNQQIVQMYYDNTLQNQHMESLDLTYAPIDEDFIDNLPGDLKELHLNNDNFIRDLSNLPFTCPYLETLTIGDCTSINDFSFVDNFKNLKSFKIYGETTGVTQELINKLNDRGIEHNLDNKLVELNNQIEEIAKSIIDEDMSEEEKMEAIVNYVISHVEYDKAALSDIDIAEEYNEKTLSSALNGKGVCSNYAALTTALCSKANITSYNVHNSNHTCNLVKIEDKYYYIDTTNICQIPILSKLIMEKLGKGFHYMQDPYSTTFSAMSDIDEVMLTEVPENLLRLINEAQDKKSFIEKYGSNYYADLLIIAGLIAGLTATVKIVKAKRR